MSRLQKCLMTTLFATLVLLFFGAYIWGIDLDALRDIEVSWNLLIVATIVSIAFRYAGIVIWRVTLSSLGSNRLPPFLDMSWVYARSWLARYIPGTVPAMASRIYLATQLGLPRRRLAVASMLEACMQAVALLSVSLLLIGMDPRAAKVSSETKYAVVTIGLLFLLLLSPVVFNTTMRTAYRMILRKPVPDDLRTNARALARSCALYAMGSFISGTAYYFLTRAIAGSDADGLYFYIVGAFGLAGVLGMMTPLLPSGIGVRDGVQLVLLSAVLPKEVALAITVVARLWSAVTDLLFFGCVYWTHVALRRRPVHMPDGMTIEPQADEARATI